MRALAASTSARPIGCTQATEILSTPGIVVGLAAAGLRVGHDLYRRGHRPCRGARQEAASLVDLLTSDADRGARRRLGFS